MFPLTMVDKNYCQKLVEVSTKMRANTVENRRTPYSYSYMVNLHIKVTGFFKLVDYILIVRSRTSRIIRQHIDDS